MIDYGLDGIETVGYVTKGVITLVTFLMLFSLGVRSKLTHVDLTEEVEELKFALSSHPEIINKTEQFIKNHWISILGTQTSYFCGVNANYGTALEAALKFGETVLVPSIAFELEEYIHGPNLQLSPNYTVFIFGNGDHTNERSATIYEATKKVSDDVYYITSNQKFEGYDGNTLVVPHVSEEVNPLVFLPVIQTIAAQVSGFLSRKQHSLLSEFKDIAKSKSDNYVDND